MITIKNLTKYILGEPLFEEVSFVLNKNDKVGIVGPNGSGKSTLMKIIIGIIESDSGSINLDHEKIGYLAQQLSFLDTDTVESFLFETKNTKYKNFLRKSGIE
jgi:ATPase subunit of ABC transporter with duplicated ATPase domains